MEETKKLKIGVFIDSFYPMIDGVINVVNNHAIRFNKFADVTVFAPTGREKFDDKQLHYKVVRCKKNFKLSFLDYDLPLPNMDSKFIDEVNNTDFDIIHIHSPFSIGRVGLETAKKKKIPVIATLHSRYNEDFYQATKSDLITNIMMKNVISVFNRCNECYAVNKQVGKIYHKEFGLKKTPQIHYNGTDLTYYENDEEILKLKHSYNIKDDEKILLYVGRIHRLKNLFFTLEVLKRLKDKNFKFKMIFVGSGPDEKELNKKINELEIGDKVILTGKIPDRELIVKHYRLADLFVFPSLFDCSSLVQIEAASQKTPTIFVRDSVTSGTCTEGVNAFFAEEDADDFSEKIIEIFSNSEEYEKIKNGAYNNLYITWDEAVQRVYEDYLKVIEDYKAGKYSKKRKAEYNSRKKEISILVKEKIKEDNKIKEDIIKQEKKQNERNAKITKQLKEKRAKNTSKKLNEHIKNIKKENIAQLKELNQVKKQKIKQIKTEIKQNKKNSKS